MPSPRATSSPRVAVIWIDWYAYHVARFRGLDAAPSLRGRVTGIELVGGVGVHAGLKFREDLPEGLAIETLLPETSWRDASKLHLARLLWRRLSALGPEVVLVPGYYTLPAIAAAVWARVHRRSSVLMTESTAADHPRSAWKEWPKRLALRLLFDWAVTGGKAHVAYLRQLGFPAARIVGCYDVVDNALFHQPATQHRDDTAAAPPYFLYVGRLAKEKNVRGLLSSWMAYRAEEGTWPLVLCGDGPERGALRTAVDHAGLSAHVHFAGLRSSTELVPFYADAGCFVLPSSREPWGLVVNEAMAAGLPVLVSNRCGCTADLLDEGGNGFTFDPFHGSDPSDSSALTRLLQAMERLSPGERARMGARSAEIISAFTPAAFGESIAGIVHASQARSETELVVEAAR